jgi:lipoprotein-anchoring transpeptidase ErfK/SrfK
VNNAGGGTSGAAHGSTPVVSKVRPPRPHSAYLLITPANGASNVAPGDGITVRSVHGATLEGIIVRGAGQTVYGTYTQSRTTWASDWALGVSQSYTVTATAIEKGRRVVETSTFRTLTPGETFSTQIYEGYLLTYGVGMPIELNFSSPITNRAAVERSLQLTTSKRVVGAWYWNGDQQVDFRTRTYWPSGTVVHFVGHLNGVEGAPGVYGDHTLTQTFVIGPSLIVVASTETHYMDVYEQGKLRYHWPISTGRPTLPTPNGTYVTIQKANPQLMVGPGYSLEVPWSVRFTLSGDFLHDAYWSVGEQGYTNVSHGCVNMPPADAEIYYNMAIPGDPVTVTGSPAAGAWNDGFTEWFLTWNQVLSGSALHEAVVAGPWGSHFVSPKTLAEINFSVPLQSSAPNNSAAVN